MPYFLISDCSPRNWIFEKKVFVYKRGVAEALINVKPRLVLSTEVRVLLQKVLPWYEINIPFVARLTVLGRFLVIPVLYHVVRGNFHLVLFFKITLPLLFRSSKMLPD